MEQAPLQPPPQSVIIPVQQQQLPPQMMAMPYTAYMPRPRKIRRIQYRHTVFKVGVGGIFLSALLFIVGYSVPAWDSKSGLWIYCSYGSCFSNVEGGPDWLDAVRFLETCALICFVVCVAVGLYQDVLKSAPSRDRKLVEILGIVAGVLGLIGIAVFGSKTKTPATYHYNGHAQTVYYIISLNWGFGLACAACILVIICSILIAFSRSQHAAHMNRVLALAGVPVPQSSSGAFPMQPMVATPVSTQYPSMQPSAYVSPNSQPYCAYPAPVTTPFMTPAPPAGPLAPVSIAQGMPMSQIPAFYVMVQGQRVPVYKEMPITAMTTTAPTMATDQTQGPDALVDGQPNQRL